MSTHHSVRSRPGNGDVGLQPTSQSVRGNGQPRENFIQGRISQDSEHLELSYSILEFDRAALKSSEELMNQSYFKQQNRRPMNDLSLDDVKRRLEHVEALIAGRPKPNVNDLTRSDFVDNWKAASELIIICLDISKPARDPPFRTKVKRICKTLDKCAFDAEKHAITVLEDMQPHEEIQEAVRIRWIYFDRIWNAASSGHTHTKRKSRSWDAILEESRLRKQTTVTIGTILEQSGQEKQTTGSNSVISVPLEKRKQTTGTIDILMWATFLVTVGLAIPTTALGWQYSAHKPGNPKDADFWFLIQSSTMALLSLFTIALPLRKGNDFPNKTARTGVLLFISAGAFSAFIAPISYLFLPTEWGALLNIFARSVQAFATLRLALTVEGATQSHGKEERVGVVV